MGSEFQAGDYGSLCREGGILAEPGRMRSIRRCGIKKKDILKRCELGKMDKEQQLVPFPLDGGE